MFAYFISARAPVAIPSIVFYVSALCSFAAAVVAVGIIVTHKSETLRQQEEPKSPETVELTSAEGSETSDTSL